MNTVASTRVTLYVVNKFELERFAKRLPAGVKELGRTTPDDESMKWARGTGDSSCDITLQVHTKDPADTIRWMLRQSRCIDATIFDVALELSGWSWERYVEFLDAHPGLSSLDDQQRLVEIPGGESALTTLTKVLKEIYYR